MIYIPNLTKVTFLISGLELFTTNYTLVSQKGRPYGTKPKGTMTKGTNPKRD